MFVTSTAYFPPLAWYLLAVQAGDWVWEAHENYQKGGWRNRCRIAAANGPLLLSVPLEGGKHSRTPVRAVRISHRTDWQRQHAQAIRSAYGRAPYFEHYGPPLLDALLQPADLLYDLNERLCRRVIALIGGNVTLNPTDDFRGAGAGAVETSGAVPAYPQVFTERHGFLANLSVLDGLFCLGPELPLLVHQW